MQQFTSKEKYLISNTLNCVPLLLQGQAVLIDLRNETSVAGRIVQSDGMMNINLEQAVFIDRDGLQYPFEQFMVRERMIRQIHIPSNIEMSAELQNWVKTGLRRPKPKNRQQAGGKRTFKQKRAEDRHKEILMNIKEQRDQKAQ